MDSTEQLRFIILHIPVKMQKRATSRIFHSARSTPQQLAFGTLYKDFGIPIIPPWWHSHAGLRVPGPRIARK